MFQLFALLHGCYSPSAIVVQHMKYFIPQSTFQDNTPSTFSNMYKYTKVTVTLIQWKPFKSNKSIGLACTGTKRVQKLLGKKLTILLQNVPKLKYLHVMNFISQYCFRQSLAFFFSPTRTPLFQSHWLVDTATFVLQNDKFALLRFYSCNTACSVFC